MQRTVLSAAIAALGFACATELTAPTAVATLITESPVETGLVVEVDASESADGNETPLSLTYGWRFLAVPAGSLVTFNNPTLARVSFVPDLAGTYTVDVEVSNGVRASRSEAVSIEAVEPAPPPNRAPVPVITGPTPACAATLQTPVAFDGSGSFDDTNGNGLDDDPDGAPLSFMWLFVARPLGSTAAFSDPASDKPTFVPDVDGAYAVVLWVTDEAGTTRRSAVLELEAVADVAAATVTVAGGDGQTGVAGEPFALANAVLVEAGCSLVNTDTVPLAGVRVRWAAVNGEVGARWSTSDANGVAQMGSIAGASTGPTVVRAWLADDPSRQAELTHTTVAGAPALLVIELPRSLPLTDQATGPCNAMVTPAPLQVTDAFRNPVGGLSFDLTLAIASPSGNAQWIDCSGDCATGSVALGEQLTLLGFDGADTDHGLTDSSTTPEGAQLRIVDDEGMGLHLVVRREPFADGMDVDDNGFVHHGTDLDEWERAPITATPPGGDAHLPGGTAWATNAAGSYNLSTGCACEQRVLSRTFDLSTLVATDRVELGVSHFVDVRNDGTYGAVAFVSVDGGSPLTPVRGDPPTAELGACGVSGYGDAPADGAFAGYRAAVFDLSPWAGGSPTVSWTLALAGTDGSCGDVPVGEGSGWYVDDVFVRVYSAVTDIEFGAGLPTGITVATLAAGAVDDTACVACRDAQLQWILQDCNGNRVDNQVSPSTATLQLADGDGNLAPSFAGLLGGGQVVSGLGTSTLVARWDRGSLVTQVAASPAGCPQPDFDVETLSATDSSAGAPSGGGNTTMLNRPDADGDGFTACDAAECDDDDACVYAGAGELGLPGASNCYALVSDPPASGDAHCYDGIDNDCAGDGIDLQDADCQGPVHEAGACAGVAAQQPFPGLLPPVVVDITEDSCQNGLGAAWEDSPVVAPWQDFCLGDTGEDRIFTFGIVQSGDYRVRINLGGGCGGHFFQVHLAQLEGPHCANDFNAVLLCQSFGGAGFDEVLPLEAGLAYGMVIERWAGVCGSCTVRLRMDGP